MPEKAASFKLYSKNFALPTCPRLVTFKVTVTKVTYNFTINGIPVFIVVSPLPSEVTGRQLQYGILLPSVSPSVKILFNMNTQALPFHFFYFSTPKIETISEETEKSLNF